MSDHALTLNVVDLAQTATIRAHAGLAVSTAVGVVTAWEVRAVDMDGATFDTYPTALVVSIREGVDVPRVAVFRVPLDTDMTQLPLTGGEDLSLVDPAHAPHEVQIWRNGFLVFWGPCVDRRVNSRDRVWEYTAYDPLWYLTRRYIGQADRHDYLNDAGNFTDFSGWTTLGSLSQSIDTARYVNTSGGIGDSARLVASASGENFIYHNFVLTSTTIGLAVILTAWVYVDAFTAPAAFSRGVFLQRIGATGPGSICTLTVDASTARGKWVRMSGVVSMPPSVTETLEVRCYAIDGTVHYDAVTVTIMESISLINEDSAGGAGWDQVQVAQQIARYAGGSWSVGSNYRKSRLNLAVAGDPSGVLMERTYQFADHQPIYQGGTGSGVLDEFPKSAAGFDYRVDVTQFTRTFRTFYPAVGVVWDAAEIIFVYKVHETDGVSDGASVGIIAWDLGESIEETTTDVCVIGGWGEGAGREEGSAAFDDLNGLTLELVESAPSGAPVALLDNIAVGRAAQLNGPQQAVILTMVEPRDPTTGEVSVPLIGVLKPGDFIPIIVEDGGFIIDNGALAGVHTLRRVTQVAFDGDDVLTVSIDRG